MENERKTSNVVLYRALRVLTALMTIISGIVITFACISAIFGDPEMLIDFIDEPNASLVMILPTILAIALTNIMALTSLGMLLFSLNRFLKLAEGGELLIDPARKALKRLGVAMILLYLTSRSLAVLIPLVGIRDFWAENRFFIPFTFIDLDFLYLLIGVVLLALGQALREGQAAKVEAKQYV